MPSFYPAPTARVWDDLPQYVPFLLGAVDAELLRDSAWQDADREDALYYMDDLKTYLLELPEMVKRGFASEITIAPVTMDVAIGNAIATSIDTAQRNAVYFAQNPAIQSQVLSTARFMAAGAWSYRFTTLKTTQSGILQMRINLPGPTAVVTVNHDLYNGSTLRNQYVTGTFTLADDSKYFIEFATNGKHASSGGYLTQITCLEMWRTGD